MTQPDMFTDAPVIPAAPSLPRVERQRLTGQNAAILARLRQGTATNYELAALSLKYTARISELRQAGYAVGIVSRDHATGRTVYALEDR